MKDRNFNDLATFKGMES